MRGGTHITKSKIPQKKKNSMVERQWHQCQHSGSAIIGRILDGVVIVGIVVRLVVRLVVIKIFNSLQNRAYFCFVLPTRTINQPTLLLLYGLYSFV